MKGENHLPRNSIFTLHTSLFTLLFLVLVLATPVLAQTPSNLNIAEKQWGFDGTVMQGRFCPLTLIVDNPTGEPFDGQVRLYRSDFGGRRLGAVLTQRVYLAPSARRIVQFYPYIISSQDHWHVEWEGGDVAFKPPPRGGPARIFIADDADVFSQGGAAMKRFPEKFFPPLASATDGLGEIVLDHVPEWDAPRRKSFLAWLRQGGTLHLLNGTSGTQPQFGQDLQVLNEPSDRFYVGGGLVRRHRIGRAKLTSAYIREQLDPQPVEENAEEALMEELENYQERYERQQTGYGYDYQMPINQWSFHSQIYEKLKKIVSPDHNWAIIHLMSLAYVAVLFPGCFLVGREFRKAPLTLGLIVGSTALFGGAFYLVGNRGYGESTNVHSVALARHIDGNRFDVMEWSNLFVTGGGYYRLTNRGDERLYSDATNTEAVGGLISSVQGEFVVDIPPFSSRVMARKAITSVSDAGPVRLVEEAGGEDKVLFRLPPRLVRDFRRAYILIGDEGMSGQLSGDVLVTSTPRPMVKILAPQHQGYQFAFGPASDEKPKLDDDQLVRHIMLHTLGVTDDKEFINYRVPEGIARVFVYAERPTEMATLGSDAAAETAPPDPAALGGQTGYVLYQFDVPL